VWAAAELRKVLGTMGARVADVELAVPRAHERFDDAGSLLEDEIRTRLGDALTALVESAVPETVAA
jgi:NAD(P)H-dependent FMN reductase